ncbi:MAG: AAA family ATPase [Chloroflexi bacterium]|nr:AAA family ATPase [Chloroflexota bacterium]
MSDVFISYVEEDADVVEPLAHGLIEAGYSCWYYQRSSLPGASYLQQISDALAQAKVVLLVLSAETLESHQVDKEISFAHDCGKPFLPVTHALAWGEFQQRRPTWRLAVGTNVAIPIPDEGVAAILPRVVDGLRGLRIEPSGTEPDAEEAVESPEPPSRTAPAEPSVPSPASYPVASPTASSSSGSLGLLPSRTTLVGRQAELEFLKAHYDAVAGGEGGRLVFISGEPGVGKTRLAQEAGLYAWSKRGLLLEGTYQRGGTAALRPWVEALRAGLPVLPRDAIAELLAAYGSELGSLFPELAGRAGVRASPPALTAEEQRLRLLDGLTELVILLSRQSPLVFVLNDLQWSSGIAAIVHLARRLGTCRALILGTFRDQEFKAHPLLSQHWAELNRARLATQISLQPLSEAGSRQLIAQYLGDETASQLGELIHRQTHGNPFFVEEVLRSLVEDGAVRAAAGGWELVAPERVSVPESMRLVVEERVSRLGESTWELLSHASILGQEFGLASLVALSGRPEDELVDLIERCINARLLVDRSLTTEERFAFADDQVKELLYASVTPLRRRRVHVRAGQVLESIYAGHLDSHLDELAHHFFEGRDVAKALDYASRAAERAARLGIWERAFEHYRRALALLAELPEAAAQQASILERLTDLEVLLGRPILHSAERALELYTKLGDRKKAARMHQLVARAYGSGTADRVDWSEAVSHFQAAVDLLLDDSECAELSYAYADLTIGLLFGRLDLTGATGYARKALAIAERLGDANQAAYAGGYLSDCLAFQGNLAEAELHAERAWQAAERGDDPYLTAIGAIHPIMVWPWRNDRAWLERWLERGFKHRRRTRAERWDLILFGQSALAAALLGRPTDAAEAVRRANAISAERPSTFSYLGHSVAVASAVLGDWEGARRLFEASFQACITGSPSAAMLEVAVHYGRFLLLTDDLAKAREILEPAASVTYQCGCVLHELSLLPLYAELCVRTGELGEAENRLSRARDILAQPQEWRGLTAAVHRAAGILAGAKRDWAESEHAFARALEAEQKYGFLYHEAHVLLPWAEHYFRRAQPGDRERGLEKLGQALVIFEQCQAKREIERVSAHRQAIGLQS